MNPHEMHRHHHQAATTAGRDCCRVNGTVEEATCCGRHGGDGEHCCTGHNQRDAAGTTLPTKLQADERRRA